MALKLVKGDDRPIHRGSSLTVIKALREYKKEASTARRSRLAKNRFNNQVFMGEQDWSEKQPGQSTEFIPKLGIASEQFTGFIKRALTQFGDFFSIELNGQQPMLPEDAKEILKFYLEEMPTENVTKTINFTTLITDAIKLGSLESLITLKIHGHAVSEKKFIVEEGELGQDIVLDESTVWRPRIDLVSANNYLPDPKGEGLYEIHTVERDISHVVEMAEAGIYDPEVVNLIQEDFQEKEGEFKKREYERGQDESKPPSFRKRIVIDELWGTILRENGRVAEKNILTAVANDKFLIRPPESNPFWHQESPFVSAPLLRVPQSVWHKALYDHSAGLNVALNEMFNLMLDGGLASVWGIKQVRPYALENEEQISDGISQGMSLVLREDFPLDGKAIETVTEGQVPVEALQMFSILSDLFAEGSFSNELKFGQLPANVKATTVLEATRSQDTTLDSIVGDLETEIIGNTLRKTFLNIMQHAEDLDADKIENAIGQKSKLALDRLTPAERFQAFAGNMDIRVFGVTGMLIRQRNFQKFAALLQLVSGNPILLATMFKRFDPNKILDFMIKSIDINPKDLEREEVTMQRLIADFEDASLFAGLSGQGGGINPQGTGDAGTPQEINQLTNPMSGLTPSG